MATDHVGRRRILTIALFAVPFALLGTMIAVRADVMVAVSGQVTSVLGSPINGATVSDGSRSATTNSSGAYSLEVPAGSTASLTASATSFAPGAKTVLAVPGATANFSLLFSLSPTISPAYFNVSPQSLTLIVVTQAPSDSAVSAMLPSGSIALPFIGVENGAHLFRAVSNVQPTMPGSTSVTFSATRLGSTVAQSTAKSYLFDQASPVLGSPAIEPSVGGGVLQTTSAFPRLTLPAADSAAGIDPGRLYFDLTDPSGVQVARSADWDGSEASHIFGTAAAAGVWTWTSRIYDRAGNISTTTTQFEVNAKLPFVDGPPSIGLTGTPVVIRGVLPIAANTVRLRVTKPDSTVSEYPMYLEDRVVVATIPATSMQTGKVRYRVVAATDNGDVVGPEYEMFVGVDPNPNGLFPGVTANRQDQVPLRAWGQLDSQVGLSLPGEASPIAPGAFAIDPELNGGRTYIIDTVFNRVKAYAGGGSLVLNFSLPSDIFEPTDIAVVPQTHEIFVLDPDAYELLRYSSVGTLLQRITVPRPSKRQPTYPPPQGIQATTNAAGGWNLYISQGVQSQLYPIFIDGTYVSVQDSLAQVIPGLPLTSGLYAKVSFAELSGGAVPVLGIVDGEGSGASNLTVPLPAVSGVWIPDSIEDIYFDSSVAGRTRMYIPVGVHMNDANGNIVANEWQIFGVDVRVVPPPGGIGLPQVTVAPILQAELPAPTYAPQNRVFATAFNQGYLYQMVSFESGLRVDRYSWTGCALC